MLHQTTNFVRKGVTFFILTLLGITWIGHAAAFGIGLSLIISHSSLSNYILRDSSSAASFTGITPKVGDCQLVLDWIKLDIINSAFIVTTSSYGGSLIIRKWLKGIDGKDVTQPSLRKKIMLFVAFLINIVEICWGAFIFAKLDDENHPYPAAFNTRIFFITMFAAACFKTLFCFISSNWVLFNCAFINKKNIEKNTLVEI
jgi:hypothetical protein